MAPCFVTEHLFVLLSHSGGMKGSGQEHVNPPEMVGAHSPPFLHGKSAQVLGTVGVVVVTGAGVVVVVVVVVGGGVGGGVGGLVGGAMLQNRPVYPCSQIHGKPLVENPSHRPTLHA